MRISRPIILVMKRLHARKIAWDSSKNTKGVFLQNQGFQPGHKMTIFLTKMPLFSGFRMHIVRPNILPVSPLHSSEFGVYSTRSKASLENARNTPFVFLNWTQVSFAKGKRQLDVPLLSLPNDIRERGYMCF